MDKKQTVQWIVTAVLRLIAGFVAVKFGVDAVSDPTWTTLGEGLVGVIIAGASVYTSIKARRTLLATEPPK